MLKGRLAWGRGGEIPRACRLADALMLGADADLLHAGLSGRQPLEVGIGAETILAWLRAVRAPSAMRATSWRSLEALLRTMMRRCLYGCALRVGYTCRTCTPRRCHALRRRTNRGLRGTARRAWDVQTIGEFVGGTSRLGRQWMLQPVVARELTRMWTLQFGGPPKGLGRVRLTTEAELR